MVENWWNAHELEVYVWLALLAFAAVVGLWGTVAAVRRERAKRRKDGLL